MSLGNAPSSRLTVFVWFLMLFFVPSCQSCRQTPAHASFQVPNAQADARTTATVAVKNETAKNMVVLVTFGAPSSIIGWEFCKRVPGKTACTFVLNATSTKRLPLDGKTLNATFTFHDEPFEDEAGSSPVCNTTQAEVNVNNPSWYDILDISLVNGYSHKVEILTVEPDGSSKLLGPVRSPNGNERAFGVYPLGCDGCTLRVRPPCGYTPGTKDGCKGGTQYKPDVPCQYQGTVMGGGTQATITFLP